jgi:hypothetical protein
MFPFLELIPCLVVMYAQRETVSDEHCLTLKPSLRMVAWDLMVFVDLR